MAKTKHEKYVMQTISRESISLAEYNPRFIDEANRKALEQGLKKHGLVEPLVWNKRSGRLVSGHQRLATIDKLERGTDYELTVAVVDLNDKDEKILNVQLNNPSMQGKFDIELLGELALGEGINFDELGFDSFDVNMMFGNDERFAELFTDTEEVKAVKAEISEIKEHRDSMNEKYNTEQNADFYFVVVCENQAEKDALLKKMSVPLYEKFITSKELQRLKK